ncbi:hypothetical protein WJX82_001403 [Trebouxia sp. C0006]
MVMVLMTTLSLSTSCLRCHMVMLPLHDLQALQAAENVKAQQALNSQLYVGVHPVQAEATDASSPESPIIPTLEIIPV